MVHPDDYDAMVKVFRGEEPPPEVVDEYELQRKMTCCWGHSGALGMTLLIPMLRMMGYGKLVTVAPTKVDWQEHLGERVVAQYGDARVGGRMVGFGASGRLDLDLDGYGRVELPRYCVQLEPTKEMVAEKDAWAAVKRGTKVKVTVDGHISGGRFIESTPNGVRVKVGDDESLYSPESVELSA